MVSIEKLLLFIGSVSKIYSSHNNIYLLSYFKFLLNTISELLISIGNFNSHFLNSFSSIS